MRLFSYCIVLAICGAQVADPLDEARMEAGQCYSSCMDRYGKFTAIQFAQVQHLIKLLVSNDFYARSEEYRDAIVKSEKSAICILAQSSVRSLDACYYGCIDVETAYGKRVSSHAKNRFVYVLRAERQPLIDAGLWTGYNTSPLSGEAFDTACAAYLAPESGDSSSIIAPIVAPLR